MLRRTFLQLVSGAIFSSYFSSKPCSKRKRIWVSMQPQPHFLATYRGYNYNGSGKGLNGWENTLVHPRNPESSYCCTALSKKGTMTICGAQSIDVIYPDGTKRTEVSPHLVITPPFLPGMKINDHDGKKALVVNVKLINAKNISLGSLVKEGYHNVEDLCKELEIKYEQLKDWWVWQLQVNDFDHYKFLYKSYPYIFSQTPDCWNPETPF